MARSLRTRIIQAEAELLHAFMTGGAAVQGFADAWTALEDEVREADHLDDETHQLLYAVTTRITILAEKFAHFDEQTDTMVGEERQQVERIMEKYVKAETMDPTNSTQSKQAEAGYHWLLKNLHNPYPTSDVKQAIADESGAPIKNVDEWFQRARRRIGWNDLRARRFSGNKNDMLDAAFEFFVKQGPLDGAQHMEFSEIEVKAKHMYNDRFHVSDHCRQLGNLVKSASKRTRSRHEEKSTRGTRAVSTFSDVSSLSASSSTSAATSSTKSAGKRKRGSSEESSPRSKRVRDDDSLFSPAASTPAPWGIDTEPVSPTTTVVSLSPSRKRRSSFSDASHEPKRPRGTFVGPRAQAVSASIPKSASLSNISGRKDAMAARDLFRSPEDVIATPTQQRSVSPSETLVAQQLLPEFDLQDWLVTPDAITVLAKSAMPAIDFQPATFIPFDSEFAINPLVSSDEELIRLLETIPGPVSCISPAATPDYGDMFNSSSLPVPALDVTSFSTTGLVSPAPSDMVSAPLLSGALTIPTDVVPWDVSLLPLPAVSMDFPDIFGGVPPDFSLVNVLEPSVSNPTPSFGSIASFANPMVLPSVPKPPPLIAPTAGPVGAIDAQIEATKVYLAQLEAQKSLMEFIV